jgi:hypothetical protein
MAASSPVNVPQLETSVQETSAPWKGNVLDFAEAFQYIDYGCSDIGQEVSLKGKVHKIVKRSPTFQMYEIVDHKIEDWNKLVKVLCRSGDYTEVDEMTFEELHEDIEEGDVVKITGYPHRSTGGHLCVYASFMEVREYGDNEYEPELPSEEDEVLESDREYEPEAEMESDDDEDFDDNVDEEGSECVTDFEDNEPTSPVDIEEMIASEPNVLLRDIPLRIFNEQLIYCNRVLNISSVLLDEAFKVTIKTYEGLTFIVTKLDNLIVGVTVPANDVEDDCDQHGYDVIQFANFADILRVLA